MTLRWRCWEFVTVKTPNQTPERASNYREKRQQFEFSIVIRNAAERVAPGQVAGSCNQLFFPLFRKLRAKISARTFDCLPDAIVVPTSTSQGRARLRLLTAMVN
jgi:hypothetical protein